jgi:kanamycin kinase
VIPASVHAVARGRAVREVWRNELGGVTYAVGDACHVKWTPRPGGLDAERERLAWARAYVAVPEVLEHGADDEGAWMVTRTMAGASAVDARWLARPAEAVAAIGAGLRAFHDALPVAACPFSWSADDRLADVARRAASIRPERWHPSHRHLDVPRAREMLAEPPPVDRLVVCHGDTCAPNTLIADDGACNGHVDVGALGVADRWADLAVATFSTTWNYGDGWERALLDAYGIAPDEERTAYYRLLWDLGP